MSKDLKGSAQKFEVNIEKSVKYKANLDYLNSEPGVGVRNAIARNNMMGDLPHHKETVMRG